MKACVEHDNGEGEDVASVRIGEYVRIQLAVPEESILEVVQCPEKTRACWTIEYVRQTYKTRK